MVFAVTTGRQGIMLRHTQGESSRAQGPLGAAWYMCTQKHTDQENWGVNHFTCIYIRGHKGYIV